ncbi:MAG TPA: folylpolyglutamate synthase/dihydrofolate synthase family protein [Alphaproteobacteria bacterium]
MRHVDAVLDRLLHLHPKSIDLSLERIARLLVRLGRPERRLAPVVHVAGTNGKGSVIAYLRAILEAAGQVVHVYTSPHLVRFAERIRIAGRLIEDDALAALLEECEQANAGQPITFFEITTAAAMLAFARRDADFALLETGLGGRLDATNVVTRPRLAAITPIALDHQQFLGETLAEIAAEKAAIIKPGVPCVVGRQPPEAAAVIARRAAAVGAPTLALGTDWSVRADEAGFGYRSGATSRALPTPSLPGPHQIDNAGVAVACIEQLAAGGVRVPDAAVAAGLAAADWPGRLQRLATGALACLAGPGIELWLDGGHNPAAGVALAASVRALWDGDPVRLVVGMMNTKDVAGFLEPLAPVAASLDAVAIPGQANALPPAAVAAAAAAHGIPARVAPDVPGAIAYHAARGEPAHRMLICGSLYLAGAVLALNRTPPRD